MNNSITGNLLTSGQDSSSHVKPVASQPFLARDPRAILVAENNNYLIIIF